MDAVEPFPFQHQGGRAASDFLKSQDASFRDRIIFHAIVSDRARAIDRRDAPFFFCRTYTLA